MRCLIPLLLIAVYPLPAQPSDARNWINTGVQAFRNARYQDAIDAFEKAAALDPNDINAHLYLGTVYMQLFIPGADSLRNQDNARSAETEFKRALELDPNNLPGTTSLALLTYDEAAGAPNPDEKIRLLLEARDLYQRVLTLDPQAKEAYYTLGVIAWQQYYPALMAARARLGMAPEAPGPLSDVSVRLSLKSAYWGVVNDGISSLQKALAIDPNYGDAMAYINLLIRERADLRDTPEEFRQDTALADQWIQRTLDVKRAQPRGGLAQAPPPPPPPPPPAAQAAAGFRQIRVGADVEAANLITKVAPVYPQMAKTARIQGAVRFSIVVGTDGRVSNMQLISGHPLLVPAATDAVRQWVYRPTLLNGMPIDVATEVNVNFTLIE